MRVVCMIPSWTETLIECGVQVVGRTRYCVHPAKAVSDIPIVGGTKTLNLEILQSLKPDLLILDKEENLKWMKDKAQIPVLVTHVDHLNSMPSELNQLSRELKAPKLNDLAERYKTILETDARAWSWKNIPGQLSPLIQKHDTYQKLIYVIWKKPWMAVGPNTFIGSVLEKLGAGAYLWQSEEKYPQFEIDNFDVETTYFLFSSEPYPFARELLKLPYHGSLVDGESYSWFGIRTLRFLEKYLNDRQQYGPGN